MPFRGMSINFLLIDSIKKSDESAVYHGPRFQSVAEGGGGSSGRSSLCSRTSRGLGSIAGMLSARVLSGHSPLTKVGSRIRVQSKVRPMPIESSCPMLAIPR